MPISAHPYDVYCWYTVAIRISKNGPFALQSFPPLWYHYMLVPIAYAYSWLSGVFSSGAIPVTSLPSALNFYPSSNILFVPGMLFNTVVKIPFFISDIAVTLLLYKLVEQITKNKALAQKAAAFWFLNPFVIWISAVWGTWDTLPVLFSLAALYFLLNKKIVFSAICLSLAVALKLYPVIFLLPIGVYLYKTGQGDKLRNNFSFFSIFAGFSLLLFLPYLGEITSFVPNAVTSSLVTDPIANPVGSGLTYWSLYLLNRLILLPVTTTFVSFASIASIVLVVASLMIVYWKTTKLTFQKPAYDLVLVLLLPVLALFLSYRIIDEQYFMWAIPFLIILCVGGRLKSTLYWGASILGFAFILLNCPLPYFFLPLAPSYAGVLLAMVHAVWAIEPLRIISLAVMGCIFSALLVLIILQLNKNHREISLKS